MELLGSLGAAVTCRVPDRFAPARAAGGPDSAPSAVTGVPRSKRWRQAVVPGAISYRGYYPTPVPEIGTSSEWLPSPSRQVTLYRPWIGPALCGVKMIGTVRSSVPFTVRPLGMLNCAWNGVPW